MKPLSIASSLVIVALSAAPLLAQQSGAQTPPPTPATETKPEAKVAALTTATLAGKWNVTVESQGGQVLSTLDVKADPKDTKKFTGTIVSQMGEASFAGELVDGKFTFTFAMTASSGQLNITCTGTQQKDGTLAGSLNYGQGEAPFTAVKSKEK